MFHCSLFHALGWIHLNHAFTSKTFRLNKSFASIEFSIIFGTFKKISCGVKMKYPKTNLHLKNVSSSVAIVWIDWWLWTYLVSADGRQWQLGLKPESSCIVLLLTTWWQLLLMHSWALAASSASRRRSQSGQLIEIDPLKSLLKITSFWLFNATVPFEIFLGLFWGLPFIGLPWRELIVFWGLPRCGLPVFERGNTGINFSRVGDGNKAPSSTSATEIRLSSIGNAAALDMRQQCLPINLHYLAQLYAPNGVEWSHVSNAHRDCRRWWFDCQSAALIQEHVDPMASLASFCSYSPFPCLPLWLAWLMKLMIKHLMSCDATLDPTIRPACSATRDESHPSIRGSAKIVASISSKDKCHYWSAYSVFARFFPQLKHLLVPGRIIRVSISDDFIVDFVWTVLLKTKFLLFTLKSRFEVFPVLVLDVFPAKVTPVIYKEIQRQVLSLCLPLVRVDNIANKRFQLMYGGYELNFKQNEEKEKFKEREAGFDELNCILLVT